MQSMETHEEGLLVERERHHFKEEEMKSVGELSQVCSQIVLKCIFLGTDWKT